MGPTSFVLVVLAGVAHAECGDRVLLLDALDRQVVEGRFEQAEATKQAVVAAFGCGSLADPPLVARLWLAEAVMLSAQGDNGAIEMFAAAARLSPGTWTEIYGPALRKQWEDAGQLPAGVSGTVRIEPLLPDHVAALDGAVMAFPSAVVSGPHLLQVGPTPSDIGAALRFDLPSGLDLVLDPKLPPKPAVPDTTPARDVRGRRVFHALVVGGVGAAMYSATFATHAAFYHAPPAQRSAELRAVNDGLILTSAATGALSAVLLVRGIASPPMETGGTDGGP